MIFLYTLLLLLVGVVHFLIKRRVASVEKKYAGVVKEADELIRQGNYRDGNSNRQDPYQSAKRQYKLALLADKRDRTEASYTTWQSRAERLSKLRQRLRVWKGRKLPYTFGAVDVACAMGLLDYLGAGHYLNARRLMEMAAALFTR
ncbi:MAG: hypothetical protein ACYC3I_22550 [Gemmataceae bacterium]